MLILWYVQDLVSIAAMVRTEISILEGCNSMLWVLPGKVHTVLGPYTVSINTVSERMAHMALLFLLES